MLAVAELEVFRARAGETAPSLIFLDVAVAWEMAGWCEVEMVKLLCLENACVLNPACINVKIVGF
jgi:hypothetical protein